MIIALLVTSGCGEVATTSSSCKLSCTADSECPSGQTCGELGLCAAAGDTCSCTAGEFIACNADSALFCNAQANGIMTESCGVAGCNAGAGRCNACVVDTSSCSADHTTLDHCGSDGVVAQSEACAAGCVTGTAGAADRCGYVKPAWLPDVCNDPATMPNVSLANTPLDTQQDSSCTGGVLQVNGTTFCVIRAGTIVLGDLKVTGTRAIAFVADDALTVNGTLDISADGPTAGPGAGTLGAGTPTINASYQGGGGAGFAQAGGAGGGNDTGTIAGMAGGPTTDRLTTSPFVGGATTSPARCDNGTFFCLNSIDFPGGGGGGGALLIACRGKVSVSATGTIDAGGGGGTGGGDHYPAGGSIAQGGAPGGGSGGFVVFQGVRVEITGKLYANGGGGGAGCGTDNCRGLPGSDGLRSSGGAPGGDPAGNTCGGGIGGSVSSAPGTGERTFSTGAAGSGGGGGSTGRFLTFTPSGVAPVLTPVEASPGPEVSSTSLPVQ
ncbi:MAG TPA: hypothetical protein VLB44_00955 [Kofleriaceae bacterium]|nr:hypothetical protein [Kofleriaceae bacterium]